ncbi:hypothetical protein DERF_014954 [Dermatophagoides farinae]|uniref:Uncharacterized protein n=1 Tax=Dermatophagoides farinae TaxID=6954 RepID=A0A922HNY8_DERFA|nr:hypothetical protein DERF_014954 [Dermatophagoides farinae]
MKILKDEYFALALCTTLDDDCNSKTKLKKNIILHIERRILSRIDFENIFFVLFCFENVFINYSVYDYSDNRYQCYLVSIFF